MNVNQSLQLQVANLTVAFQTRDGIIIPNDNISFSQSSGEWLGIMGPSGSGKSVLVRSIAGLLTGYPGILEGKINFHNNDLLEGIGSLSCFSRNNGTITSFKKQYDKWQKYHRRNMVKYARRSFAYIFQNPYDALNPYFNVGYHIKEAYKASGRDMKYFDEQSKDLLAGLMFRDPSSVLRKYPHELSGGMAQRIVIAMALAQQASVIIADECTTSLDLASAEHTMKALHAMQEKNGCSILFITHDAELAREHSNRILKINKGKLVGIDESVSSTSIKVESVV